MRQILTVLALVVALPAVAQDWAMREGDILFTESELDALLRGEILTFHDGGQSEYYEDDRYTYTYGNEGGVAYGYFVVQPDSIVCISFVNGFSRCDRYVVNDGRLVMLTDEGQRFPIRSE